MALLACDPTNAAVVKVHQMAYQYGFMHKNFFSQMNMNMFFRIDCACAPDQIDELVVLVLFSNKLIEIRKFFEYELRPFDSSPF